MPLDAHRSSPPRGLPEDVPFSRYNEPVGYSLNLSPGESLPSGATLEQLSSIFTGKPLETLHE